MIKHDQRLCVATSTLVLYLKDCNFYSLEIYTENVRLNKTMNKPITIENLSTNEKIELMEKLWEDLSSSSDYSPPEWHGDELARRKNTVEEGKETYTEWNKAKEEIRKEVS